MCPHTVCLDSKSSPDRVRLLWEDKICKNYPTNYTIRRSASGKTIGHIFARINEKSEKTTTYPYEKSEGKYISTTSQYQLLEPIGEGGMGVVFLARQLSIDRKIAIKMMKSELAQDADVCSRFLKEAQVTGCLNHPNIVSIHELGRTSSGRTFIAMELVNGKRWDETIKNKPLKENLNILMRVCDAIAFAHSKGIIHRDLKPENVMLGEFGEVILMDWGLAALVDSNGKVSELTKDLALAGTPAYMPPEVALCQMDQIGKASDIYMLGGILFEIITGSAPHTGENVIECLEAAARNVFQLTDRKDELYDIAMKAMATKPEDRFESVKEFQAAVEDYLFHLESLTLTHSAQETLRKAGNDYLLLSRALALFEEAVKLWPQNMEARKGIINTRKIYASIALARGDLDLGRSLILPKEPEHFEIKEAIAKAVADRKRRTDRYHILTYVFLAFIVIVLIFLVQTRSLLQRERDAAYLAMQNLQTQLKTAQKTISELEKKVK